VGDEDKAVKAGLEVVFQPVADLIQKIAGPAAEEFELTLKDYARVVRLKRQVRLWQRAKEFLLEVGIEPKRVPFKLLGPIIESGSLEEDDSLQDKWAALLANAATKTDAVHPSSPEVLKQLSEWDVLYLDVTYEFEEERSKLDKSRSLHGAEALKRYKELDNTYFQRLSAGQETTKSASKTAREALTGLLHSDLHENVVRLGLMHVPGSDMKNKLTNFGRTFVRACRPPTAGEDQTKSSMSSSG